MVNVAVMKRINVLLCGETRPSCGQEDTGSSVLDCDLILSVSLSFSFSVFLLSVFLSSLFFCALFLCVRTLLSLGGCQTGKYCWFSLFID